MPYARDFGNGQSIRTVGGTVLVETHLKTLDGSPGPVSSCSFEASRFLSAEVLHHQMRFIVDGVLGDMPHVVDGGYGWGFGVADVLEAVAAARAEG